MGRQTGQRRGTRGGLLLAFGTALLIAAAGCAAALAVSARGEARVHGLDRSYGKDGVVEVPPPFPQQPFATLDVEGFTAAGDGDAYVFGRGYSGKCTTGSCEPEQILRFNHAGRRDGSYGHRGVLVLPSEATGYTMFADHAARLVVGAVAGDRVVVRRFTAAGRHDRSFGRGGTVSLPGGGKEARLRLFEIGAGKVLVDVNQGIDRKGRYDVATKVRLTELRRDGRLDRGFGRGGSLAFKIPRPGPLTAVAPAPDGSILLGGGVHHGRGHGPVYLWRVSPDGRVDHAFVARAARSARRLDPLGDHPELNAIVPRAGGGVAALGSFQGFGQLSGFYLRLGADGRPDRGFADGGAKRLPFSVLSALGGLHGAVFAVGWGHAGYRYRAFRIFPGGAFDPRYHGAKGRSVPLPGQGVHVFAQGVGRVLIANKGRTYCRSGCAAEPAMARFRE